MEADWKSGMHTYYQRAPSGSLKKCKSLKAVSSQRNTGNKSNGKLVKKYDM